MVMSKRYPCGGVGRRQFLASGLAMGALAGQIVSAQEPKAAAGKADPGEKFGVPGPYPGRVIEVRNKAMIRQGVKNREAIKTTLSRGMKELTGADDAVQAWRSFFEPGDVVGIKMNPVGNPLANTSSELMLEVIAGLEAAGVKKKDMIVFERYKLEFMDAGMHNDVPDGIAWDGMGTRWDPIQLDIKGYDPDEFVSMEVVGAGQDPKDDRARRSHLGLIVTRRVNKIVMLPMLKDHGSAGVTGALKNMSHGLVNNVNRSHSTPDSNVCNTFIPTVVSHPIIRKKCVLHIMDGIKGVYQGGPHTKVEHPEWVWEYNALFFGTDPVAMDHVEWRIIDAKRQEMGLAPVAAVGQKGQDASREGFDFRQPQHITLAGHLGLGIYDFNSPLGRRQSIDHRVTELS
jgi:Domain of unknown function (DUF362)